MKKFGYIYQIVNKINQKIYIGQTIRYVSKRWYEHKKYARNIRNNTLLSKSMRKYGIDNFTIKTICWCDSLEQLNHRERYYIRLLQTLNPKYGYNLTEGGYGGAKSPLTRKKMSLANLGTKKSEETKRKCSESQKGSKSAWWGRKHNEETKKKIGRGNRGKVISKDTREKISKAKKGWKWDDNTRANMKGRKTKTTKKVLNLESGRVYNSLREAGEKEGVDSRQISAVCRGKQKTTHSKRFIYID